MPKSKWDCKYASAWTTGAIDCYKRNCRCEGCLMQEILETPCTMKIAVIELIRKFGIPSDKPKEKKINEKQQKILEAILNGAESYEDLYIMTNYGYSIIQTYLSNMYIDAKKKGLKFKNGRYKLPEFVKWVRANENT